MKRKQLLAILVIIIVSLVAGSSSIINNVLPLRKQKEAKAYNTSQELIGSYEDAEVETAQDSEGNEIPNLELNVYFLDEAGNKKRGIYKEDIMAEEGGRVRLYVDIGLSQDNASIVNCRVRLPIYNAYIIPELSEGGIIKKKYADNDIELNEIVAGNSANLSFLMRHNVYGNSSEPYRANYSRENDLIIEGDYIDENENVKHFSKTFKWKLDWDANTKIKNVRIDNRIESSGNLIRLKDNRIVALFEVISQNENGAIPANGEYKMSGFKVNGIEPEIIVSPRKVGYTIYDIEDTNYDSASDTLTWKTVARNGGAGAYVRFEFNSYVTLIYPPTLYNDYLKNQTNTVENQLNIECKNMAFVNPNIQHIEGSLYTPDQYPELGTRYTDKANASYTIRFDSYDGELFSYDTHIIEQNKINSELIYYGINTQAGYKETHNIVLNVGGGIIENVKVDWTNDNPAEHSFIDNNENYYSHEDFKYYTGISIDPLCMQVLGSDGWLCVYDAETGELIAKYTKEGLYKYDSKHKKIRIVTSKVVNPGQIVFHNLVEIDNEKLKEKYPTLSQFETFTKLATSSNAYIKIKGNKEYSEPYGDWEKTDYFSGRLNISIKGPFTADTYETSRINYAAVLNSVDYSNIGSASCMTYYNNPKVLVEFPNTIKSKSTKYVRNTLSVISNGKKMEATISGRLTKNNKDYFIISIKGETTDSIIINASFDVVPKTTTIKNSTDINDRLIRTFANTTYDGTQIVGNVYGGMWNETAPDTYDWNGNGIYEEENYFCETTEIIYTEPIGVRVITGLVLEGNEEEVLSPNIMELNKLQDDGKKVTVNNYLYNYSDGTIKSLKLISRIPYKGNKFLKSGDDMNSTFDTIIASEIKVPDELKGKVTIKYSTEDVDIIDNRSVSDIQNSKFKWTTKFSSDAKSYMIDFGDLVIDKGSAYKFSYTIKLPETLNYGLASYTSDAIVFNNISDEGEEVFAIPVESPKVGLSVESEFKFNINFTKVDKNDNTKELIGAKYKLTRADGEQIKQGEELVDFIEFGADTESSFSINGLYPDIDYKLEEIQAPTNYRPQDIIFKIIHDESLGFVIETSLGELKDQQYIGSDGHTIKYEIKIPEEQDDATYKVQYLYEQVDGSYKQMPDRPESTERKGIINSEVSASDDDLKPLLAKYELSTTHDATERSGIVRADNSLILKVYFDFKAVNYKVKYFYLNDNGVYPKTPVSIVNAGPVKVGTTINRNNVNTDPTRVENAPAGKYLLDDEDSISTERTDSSLVITANEASNVFNVYFTKGYTVTYKPGTQGTFSTKSKSDIPHGTLTPLLIDNKTHRPGYEFTGWLEENTETPLLQDSTISKTKVTHDITYVAQWKALDVPYKVEFYYQQDNGTYPTTPYAVVNRIGTTDTPVSLTVPSRVNDFTVRATDNKETNADISRPKTDRNYIYDTNAGNIVADDAINGDGTTVLKVFFKQIPVKYNVDVVLKDTANNTLPRNEFTITRQRGTDTTILWNNKAVNDNTEINENNLIIDTYTYKITEDTAPNSRYVNVLNGKYILVTTQISNEGLVSIKNWGVYENDTLLPNTDAVYSYVDVNLDTPTNADRAIKVKVINPVTFTVELTKVDTDGNSVANTGISINSSIINGQNAIHKDEIVTESKDGLTITDNGLVSGSTNKNGIIRYEETWVNTNEYTYEITETKTAGNQYVNILDGYKVVVKVRVGADGTLTAVPQNGRTFVIVATEPGKVVTDDLYKYVAIDVTNNSLSAIIKGTDELKVNVTNPVRFDFDINKKSTDGLPLAGTKFTVTREGKDTPIFEGEPNEEIEIREDPIDSGTYTYLIRENNTNKIVGNRYVNVLEGKYIKLRVKVNANGIIDIVNNNNKTDNNDYFEVYEESGKQVTDNNVLRYISVSSTDLDGDGVYKLDVNVTNPVRYEIDIITKDTLNQFLNGVNVSLYKVVGEENKDLYTDNAVEEVEKLEMPADAGTYTYYVKENSAPTERYINVLNNRYIEIKLTVAPNGMLTETHKLYEGEIGKGKEITTGEVLERYSVAVDNTGDVSRLNITIVNPVRFVVEVDKYDTAEAPLTNTTFEIESPIIESQGYEHNNEKINGIEDDGITADGVVTGKTDNAIEKSKDGNMQRARISYEETWVDANDGKGYYTYYIRETKTAGAQYVNMLEGHRVVVRARVGADGTLTLVDKNGNAYAKDAKYKFTIETEEGQEIAVSDETIESKYKYVNIEASNNKILATMNASVINPVRYNIAVYETIYGDEKVKLNNIPVEIQSEFSGSTTLVTAGEGENAGYATMEERAVWADTYEYRIFQLNKFNGNNVEGEFVNMLDGYYIGIDLYVPGNGDIKTISKDGDYTTVSYKLYKKTASGEYAEIDFNDTIVDDFVKVKITKDENNVCTLNIYIVTPEKYNFRLKKTDIDVLYSVNKYPDKYPEVSPNMNDVEFTVTVKDANGDIVLKDTKSGKDAKSEFATINTKSQLTKNVKGVDGILDFNNILIERCGTYTFEIEEVTPKVEGMIYKDKSEPIILTADIVVKDGKYVLENMTTAQAERYTIKENTRIAGTQTQTVNVNVTNERIKGKYDLDLNKVNKFTGLPLDGAVYKVTVEQEGKEEKVLYLSNDDVLSMEQLIAYEEEESTSVNGTTSFKDIRIELPETYTIKIEEVKAPVIEVEEEGSEVKAGENSEDKAGEGSEDKTEEGSEAKGRKKITYTKLDDVIELEVTTVIEGEYDDAHYVLGDIKLKEGNHDLISEEHSAKEEEKQNIQLRIENEYFDLALRQYVVDVNGTKFDRKIEVNTDKLQSSEATDAEYVLNKEPQRAYAGQEVIYAIEVFNEGIIDGYAEEIMQYLPEGLEFVDDEFNKSFGWELNEDNTGVVTHALSKKTNEKENLIPAYTKDVKEDGEENEENKEDEDNKGEADDNNNENDNDEAKADKLSSKVIYLKLKVKEDVKLKSILTTIAEVTKYQANERKESVDRDSYDLVTLPKGEDLVEYEENQEDDDDYEKLIIEEFDLAPVKYAKSVNGEEQKERAPVEQLDETRADEYRQGIFNGFKYKNENEMLRLDQNDKIVYGIQVRNEGSVGSYATEVMDTIPSGLKFDKDSEINKKYEWKLLDAEKNPTEDVEKAAYVVTDYLSEAKGKVDEETGVNSNWLAPLTLQGSELTIDYKELEVEFIVTEPTTEDRIVKNIATISKFIDDLGINVKDRDAEERRPDNVEKIYVNIFDLELEQVINSVEVTNTKTNEVTMMDGEEIRKLAKVDIAKSKLKNTNVKVEYKITIKNNGESAGYVTELKDYIPEGFIFDANDNVNWVASDGYVTTEALSNELLNPGDTREVTLVLRWNGAAKVGVKENLSEISKHADKNKLDIVDWDSTPDNKVLEEDDIDYTTIILTVKTGSAEIAVMSVAVVFMIVTSLGITAYNRRKIK